MAFQSVMDLGYSLLDKGMIPDFVLRRVIRALLRQRLREIDMGTFEANFDAKMKWIQGVRARQDIADCTEKANEQHYEVSTQFMLSCMGPHAKYSCCLYPTGTETLEQAEELMLDLYCERARIKDGMDILDLGCGWGSLSLHLAKKYPNARIVGLSNSATQKAHIDGAAQSRGLNNLEANVNAFNFDDGRTFDRILSIEMFEHMKNYKLLMSKVASWLRPTNDAGDDESLLFIHIFCHRTTPYHFVEDDGWMAQTFFTGGTMPSHDTLLYFQDDVSLIQSWFINGKHYVQTCEDWLKKQDSNARDSIAQLEKDAEGQGLPADEGRKTFYRFRVFYMACAELFAFGGGNEWGVGHYLFRRK
ncbi:hypothetical protein NM688_g2809 [Phlebia brevispora]|uniref:Uncharacterized protein n=1 Tax=Phlebia brevispora TaxID=194682 RepID=A0ACC1T7F7_9APHY|nr:hypothetical protein NM688_g2809 [Phlebia brevispora]